MPGAGFLHHVRHRHVLHRNPVANSQGTSFKPDGGGVQVNYAQTARGGGAVAAAAAESGQRQRALRSRMPLLG